MGCILIDRSYSMGVESETGTLFDEAKERAREILGRFAPEDEVIIMLFDSGTLSVYSGSGDERRAGLFIEGAELSIQFCSHHA